MKVKRFLKFSAMMIFLFLSFGWINTAFAACISDTNCTPPATCQLKTEVTEQSCSDDTVCLQRGQGSCVGVNNVPQEGGGYELVPGHCEYTAKECIGEGVTPPEMHATTEECFMDATCKTKAGGKCENVGLKKSDDGGWENVPGAPGYCTYIGTDTGEIKFQPAVPSLIINIPNFKGFTNKGLTEADMAGYIYAPFIGQYVGAVYNWAILVGALVATIMILYGGFIWLTSRGNRTAIESARERIKSALLGLFLILGSYTLLYLINPDLVKFKNLRIQAIQPTPFFLETDEESASSNVVPELSEMVTLNDVNNLSQAASCGKGGCLVTKEIKADLVNIAATLEDAGIKLLITDAYRPPEQQWAKVNKNCTDGKKPCNPPTCIPTNDKASNCAHPSAKAVDAWGSQGGRQCGGSAKYCVAHKEECANDPCQRAVIEAFSKEGYCRLDSEVWHFEKKPSVSKNCH